MPDAAPEFAAAVNQIEGGLYLRLHVQPGAKKPALKGMHGDAIKLAVGEAAQDGKANSAVTAAVAAGLKVAKGRVSIVSGEKSRAKCLFIEGDVPELLQSLAAWFGKGR